MYVNDFNNAFDESRTSTLSDPVTAVPFVNFTAFKNPLVSFDTTAAPPEPAVFDVNTTCSFAESNVAVTPAAELLIFDNIDVIESVADTAMLVPLIENDPADTPRPASNPGDALNAVSTFTAAGAEMNTLVENVSFNAIAPENDTDRPSATATV